LALVLVMYRRGKSLDVSIWQDIRETGLPATADTEPLPPAPIEEPDPTLAGAGRLPEREAAHV